MINEKIENNSRIIPMLATRGLVAFPNVPLTIDVGRKISKKAINEAEKDLGLIFVCSQVNPIDDAPSKKSDFFNIGVVAQIKQIIKNNPDGIYRVVLQPLERAKLVELNSKGDYLKANTIEVKTRGNSGKTPTNESYIRAINERISDLISVLPNFSNELNYIIEGIDELEYLVDFVAANLLPDPLMKQEILETMNLHSRAICLLKQLEYEKNVVETKKSIDDKVRQKMDKTQRDYFLREELKAIHEELDGEFDDGEDGDIEGDEVYEFLSKLKKGNYPPQIEQKLRKEIKKYQRSPMGSPDSTVLANYLDTCFSIPFGKKTEDRLDIPKVQKILDDDHDGLEKVKKRIIEYLSTLKMTNGIKSQIICLVGPPGTGKTSVAISIAKALNKKFVRVSLGGVHDESDIRGHRKTYVASMPGRIINGLIEAKSMNPLMLLDEIDKMSRNMNGDPASALLEVLDPEQNKGFRDHFVEVPVDLSDVMFITTANSLDGIPTPLLDRMEIIELSAYTRDEKFSIAKNHLIPKQIKKHGLNSKTFKMTNDVIYELIDEYTREAGVRNLERKVAECIRRATKLIALGDEKEVKVTKSNLSKFVDGPKALQEKIFDEPMVGVVNGMAYTEFGGDLLKIEVLALEGNGKVEATGSLGNVMKESSQIAMSYVRNHANELGIQNDFYKIKDIHIHAPEGAVPKDGPSAGVTMTTALVSELTGIPVKNDISMTGEITLHGNVLPIGGLREKTMAAYTAGVRTIIIPKKNSEDLDEVAQVVKDNVNFVLASDIKEVLNAALIKSPYVR